MIIGDGGLMEASNLVLQQYTVLSCFCSTRTHYYSV